MLKLHASRQSQQGIVLLLAVIVLVAMSLAAIGLMRSVLTTNRVAANLSFQQSAMQSGDAGVERAIAWLEQKTRQVTGAQSTPANELFQNITAGTADPAGGTQTMSYLAVADTGPGVNQSWDNYWATLVSAGVVNTLATDAAGNTTSVVIQRLCKQAGDSSQAFCVMPASQTASVQTSTKTSGQKWASKPPVFYRITVRVQGTRNAVTYAQAIVNMH